jgi:hypothetical protein
MPFQIARILRDISGNAYGNVPLTTAAWSFLVGGCIQCCSEHAFVRWKGGHGFAGYAKVAQAFAIAADASVL